MPCGEDELCEPVIDASVIGGMLKLDGEAIGGGDAALEAPFDIVHFLIVTHPSRIIRKKYIFWTKSGAVTSDSIIGESKNKCGAHTTIETQ